MTSLLILSIVCGADPTGSHSWPGFRNDGSSRTTARELPVSWSPTDNVAWRIETPGYGQSSPVIWGNQIYLTAIEGKEKETLHVLSFSLSDGKKLWQYSLSTSMKGKNNPMMARAAPTPVADKDGVYAFFESGDLIALTPKGEKRWQRSLATEYGEFKNPHGLGGSPAQTDTSVVLLIDHQGPSYLVAINKGDGTNVWKTDRPARSSWTSPVISKFREKPIIIASSGGVVTGYDPASGKQMWELDGFNGNTMPSPTMSGEMIVIGATENRAKPNLEASAKSNCCLKLGSEGCETVWQGKRILSATASPLIHAGHVYLTDKAGSVHCLDLNTGEVKYSERLDNVPWATPIGAGEQIYFFGKEGVTTVLKAGPTYEKVATNRLWTPQDFEKRKTEAKKTTELPAGPPGGGNRGPAGGPPLAKEESDTMRYSAVGDVLYGVAAVDGAFILRTGSELICLRNRK